MRLYTFVNGLYMRPIQFGIQSTHLLGDMMIKYSEESLKYSGEKEQRNMLYDWAEHHKTMIILNAVNAAGLIDVFEFLDSTDNPFPYGKFHEDEQSLGGVITCVGVVLPERIYTAAGDLRMNRGGEYDPASQTLKVVQRNETLRHTWNEYQLTPYEMMLAQKLNEFGLAS